ncbi:hypothetical protein SAMN04488003_1196 [Loktanella fryxellensis]|uniref:Uncharacterized protein n=1 Tax=Loktanella fryxellensis TaxID=245187 RepID=A0A1H8H3A9_9RHOB|nr:hypothetical protein [Loktanella fryxellensis]SEN50217.1 hypothetical protein SAMN04488003_1196 [Loktanella fryxellensis]
MITSAPTRFSNLSRLAFTSSALMVLLSTTAMSQTFDRVTSTGTVQTGVSVTAPVANANNASGFELMTGTATVDGAGGTFGN